MLREVDRMLATPAGPAAMVLTLLPRLAAGASSAMIMEKDSLLKKLQIILVVGTAEDAHLFCFGQLQLV